MMYRYGFYGTVTVFFVGDNNLGHSGHLGNSSVYDFIVCYSVRKVSYSIWNMIRIVSIALYHYFLHTKIVLM